MTPLSVSRQHRTRFHLNINRTEVWVSNPAIDTACSSTLPAGLLCVSEAAVDPPGPGSALPDWGSAPAAGSAPVPTPPPQIANHLGSSGNKQQATKEKKKKHSQHEVHCCTYVVTPCIYRNDISFLNLFHVCSSVLKQFRPFRLKVFQSCTVNDLFRVYCVAGLSISKKNMSNQGFAWMFGAAVA